MKALLPIFIPAAEIPRPELSRIIDEAFATFAAPDILPVVQLDELVVIELFHGETGAFKDLAMSVIGRMLDFFLRRKRDRRTIVVGTSGDTGSAAIYGVKRSENIDIIVLYPAGRISEVQELQMTTHPDRNVHVFACEGTSDDLDVPIKAVLNDADFASRHKLCSINSVNWARVCIQIAHFFYAYFHAHPSRGAASYRAEDVVPVFVPTGACGDLVGGLYAVRFA